MKLAPKSQGCLSSGATYRVIQKEEERVTHSWLLSPDPEKTWRMLAAISPGNQAAWLGKGPKIITRRGRGQRQVIIPEKLEGSQKNIL